MDFTQNKLSKMEWESLEIPVQEKEKEILKIIWNNYNNINAKYNIHTSMMSVMNLNDNDENTLSRYLYNKYFSTIIDSMIKKYNLDMNTNIDNNKSALVKNNSHKSDKKSKKKHVLKKIDKMKIDNTNSKIQGIKHDIFEYVVLDIIDNLLKSVVINNNDKFHECYYTLYHIMKFNITRVNPDIILFVNHILAKYEGDIDLLHIVRNAFSIIERNHSLLKYADMQLYEHQKQIFTISKKKHSKIILYQAPTGTGKTITPIGLAKEHKVIFVCAAKHVGLQLAKSCISMDIPLAVAFGCSSPSDVRLHYNAAKDIVKNFKTGGIFRVDNSVGDKVQVLVCDIKSYLPAMHYMLAFNNNHEIITYWDEPTITLDYKTHEFHGILQKNWLENEIPNMVLSSATLPSQGELRSMMEYFKLRFRDASIYNIVSHDCKKTIPIISSKGDIVLPHIICDTSNKLKSCIQHCKQFKTILRHFDLKEIVRFIEFIHDNDLLLRKRYNIKEYFTSIDLINSISIKEYYIDLMGSLNKNWHDIYEKYMGNNNVNVMNSNIHITTKDAHTLTDGPTIYIAEDVDKLASVLLKISEIPKDQVDKISENIDFNEKIRSSIIDLEKELQEYTYKIMGGASNDDEKEKKQSRMDKQDPTINTLTKKIQGLGSCLKRVNLHDMFIPNRPEHLERYNKHNVKNSFTCDIEEQHIENIMLCDVEPIWKVLLLLGIGVFRSHKDIKYLEIMKSLALQQKLYVIIATPDFIYGTNYQFCHGYMGKDLQNMTQEKVIQAFGRVGRNSTQMDYSIRLRNDDVINKIFFKEEDKMEVYNMNLLFGLDNINTDNHNEIDNISVEVNFMCSDDIIVNNHNTTNKKKLHASNDIIEECDNETKEDEDKEETIKTASGYLSWEDFKY